VPGLKITNHNFSLGTSQYASIKVHILSSYYSENHNTVDFVEVEGTMASGKFKKKRVALNHQLLDVSCQEKLLSFPFRRDIIS